jgi:hypothetical protein
MTNSTQIKWVKQCLRERGQISRNEALQNYVSRLGAIINKLKKDGWEFESGYDGHRNYVYKVIKKPTVPQLVWSEAKRAMVYKLEDIQRKLI